MIIGILLGGAAAACLLGVLYVLGSKPDQDDRHDPPRSRGLSPALAQDLDDRMTP